MKDVVRFLDGSLALKLQTSHHNCLGCTSMTHEDGMSNVIYCSRTGKVISDASGIEQGNTDICCMYNEKNFIFAPETNLDNDEEELPFGDGL